MNIPNISKFLFLILVILLFGDSGRIYAQQNNRDVKILWQKEFIADSNLGYRCTSSMFSQADNRLYLLGGTYKITVPPAEKFTEFWLWEIDPDGNMIKNIVFDNTKGKLNPYSALSHLQFTSDGNVQVLTSAPHKSSRARALRSINSMTVTMDGKIISLSPVCEPNEKTRTVSFDPIAMINCPDNNSLVIGGGLSMIVIKLDSNGNYLWKKNYGDDFFREVLSDACGVSSIDHQNRRYYVAEALPDVNGCGFVVGGFSYAYYADYFILRMDSDGNVLSKTMFSCHDPGIHGTWPHLFRMASGNIMVANDTNPWAYESDIMIRMYTRDLKPLFKKQLGKLAQEEYEESYRIEPVGDGGFALIDDSNDANLVLHRYDGEGNESYCTPLNIASPNFYGLEYGDKCLFIVMNTAEKVKITAVKIY